MKSKPKNSKSKKKNKLKYSKKQLYINAGALFVILVVGIILVSLSGRHNLADNKSNRSNSKSQSGNSSSNGSSDIYQGSPPINSRKPPVTSSPKTTGPCASVFTLEEAQTLMGNNAAAVASNGISSQTTDVTTITCAYSIGTDVATVTENAYNDANGSNANQIEFGSGRPSGAQHIDGFGQSAFWYNNQLNILLNNNWYLVSYSRQGNVTLGNSEVTASAAKLQASY